MLITDISSTIELSIYEDEKIHLPFNIQCTPSKDYSLIVKRYKNNILNSEQNNLKVENDLEKLLKSQGVCLVNNRWVVFNIF